MKDVTFQCPECGLHYHDENIAMACEEFCRANQACSMDIAKYAIENGGEHEG